MSQNPRYAIQAALQKQLPPGWKVSVMDPEMIADDERTRDMVAASPNWNVVRASQHETGSQVCSYEDLIDVVLDPLSARVGDTYLLVATDAEESIVSDEQTVTFGEEA